jgi:hypothetical protein
MRGLGLSVAAFAGLSHLFGLISKLALFFCSMQ